MKKFLTGLAAGLAIGYLTAPRAGKDTRQQLGEAADQQTKGLKGQWDDIVAEGKQLLDTVMENLGVGQSASIQYADKATRNVKQYANEADNANERVNDSYNRKVDDTADAAQASVNKAEKALKL